MQPYNQSFAVFASQDRQGYNVKPEQLHNNKQNHKTCWFQT